MKSPYIKGFDLYYASDPLAVRRSLWAPSQNEVFKLIKQTIHMITKEDSYVDSNYKKYIF